MNVEGRRFSIVRRTRVTSTQQEARRLAEAGCDSGTIVLAEEQTAGRGRGDHRWQSPSGLGLWMTLVHRCRRPIHEWPALTSASAMAACRTIERLELSPLAKWPNDILLSTKKVGGLLAETVGERILLGVGVNLLQRPLDFLPELRQSATSIQLELDDFGGDRSIDRDRFLDRFLVDLEGVLVWFEAEGPEPILRELWKRSIVRDRSLTVVSLSGERIEGKAIGLGPIGELCIETAGGTRTVANGTVHRMEDL